jgi:hypothetical protein
MATNSYDKITAKTKKQLELHNEEILFKEILVTCLRMNLNNFIGFNMKII